MAGPNVNQLTEMTATPAASDMIYIVDASGPSDRKISYDILKGPTTTKSADYTVTKNMEKVFVTGTCTITLPAASYAWCVKIFKVGDLEVTIVPQGSDSIEGQDSLVLAGPDYKAVTLEGDGGTLWARG
jgi:hypothetical protein